LKTGAACRLPPRCGRLMISSSSAMRASELRDLRDLRIAWVRGIGSFGRVVHDNARYNIKKQKARVLGAIQLRISLCLLRACLRTR
jgi:hypothetical protein